MRGNTHYLHGYLEDDERSELYCYSVFFTVVKLIIIAYKLIHLKKENIQPSSKRYLKKSLDLLLCLFRKGVQLNFYVTACE